MWHKRRYVIALLAMLALFGCEDQKAQIGQSSPDIAAMNAAQQTVSLESYQGKKIVLEFWSSTCGACIAMMKKWQDVYERRSDEVVVIAINIDDYEVDLNEYATKYGFSFPMVKDQLGITKERFSIGVTPTTYLINRDGKLVDMHIGYSASMDLDKVISQL
ncbi:TlpA family protein disulfide reductase [Vibrio harveyi]|uniref:TlpA family protein disulfide reductase n=1 Tax=Vibrio harveyi TaxID=669 RepID=UPI003BB7FF99